LHHLSIFNNGLRYKNEYTFYFLYIVPYVIDNSNPKIILK